jgi:Purple acid Phosphatase, N-terminal domain
LLAYSDLNGYAGEWKGYVHRTTLSSLTPGAQYFYRAGSSANWTEVFDFFAAPLKANQTSFALIGDMGTVIPYGFKVSEMMAEHFAETGGRWDFTVHAGDVAYAGTSHKREWEFIWDLFQNRTSSFVLCSPLLVVFVLVCVCVCVLVVHYEFLADVSRFLARGFMRLCGLLSLSVFLSRSLLMMLLFFSLSISSYDVVVFSLSLSLFHVRVVHSTSLCRGATVCRTSSVHDRRWKSRTVL